MVLENDREGADKRVFGEWVGRVVELGTADADAPRGFCAKPGGEIGLVHHGRGFKRTGAGTGAFLTRCHHVDARNCAQFMRKIEADAALENIVRAI